MKSMEAQMIALLAISFALLLAALAALEVLDQEDVVEWAQNEPTLARIKKMTAALDLMDAEQTKNFIRATSACHEGYTVESAPFSAKSPKIDVPHVADRVARALAIEGDRVRAALVELTRDDFSYDRCEPGSIEVPAQGLVISVKLRSGEWLNAEVHPHEWHVRRELIGWTARTLGAFLLVGALAVFFVHRLSRPLNQLTGAAHSFGSDLTVSAVEETGPPDLRRAIRSFNTMQRQVARRTHTLAAISHDLRSPLTALRIKAELIEDEETRRSLITSIEALERRTASALEYLRGERKNEPERSIDLGALIESECSNFEESGHNVRFEGEKSLHFTCRPDALAAAVRNLIDNAIKYGKSAEVTLRAEADFVLIAVADHGPGISEEKRALAVEPFERLSFAREENQSGFGLGLAIVRAIVEGHGGALVLAANEPSGLIATIRLPKIPR